MEPWVVLITGCSTGIGRALAVEFARLGHRVFPTARKVETLADLAGPQVTPLPLDVTAPASIEAAIAAVLAQAGRLDMVINNAGFGLMGPAVELPAAELRRQLETNVVGPLALAQAAAPHMIKHGRGRIVNVGSVSGILTTPFSGAYCASKAALHSLSDALRLELAPLGVQVITMQPGGIVSSFGETATKVLQSAFRPDSLYKPLAKFIEARAQAGQEDAMDAAEFARQVVPQLTAANPPILIRLGANSTRLPLYRWLLPTALTDRILSKKFGLNTLSNG